MRAIGVGVLLILAGVLGFLLGRVVRWGARGQTQQPFPAVAMTLAGVSVAVAFVLLFGSPLPLPLPGLTILAYPVAIWLAARGLQR